MVHAQAGRLPADAPYDRLTTLVRALWLPAIVNSAGTPAARLRDLPTWVSALDAGRLPPADADLGDPAVFGPLRHAVAELGLPGLAAGVPAVGEQVLRTMLWHADRVIDRAPGTTRADAIARSVQRFIDEWQLEKVGLEGRLALLKSLGDPGSMRWDDLQGLLRARGLADAQHLAGLLEQVPALVDLIERLGRREPMPHVAPPAPLAEVGVLRRPMTAVETRLAGAPGEITGLVPSDRWERQVPAEAALLRHPAGRRLWHARRAEGRLLTHETQATSVDWRPDPLANGRQAAVDAPPPARGRGPIIVCLDTSASMQGAPERLAKAVVLQAVRTARRASRGCLVLAFGGTGELVEHELADNAAGLHALLGLVAQSFDGGTDVQGPIERAIERVHEARWRQADVLIASDGEFGCTPATLGRLDEARASLGLRVQGVLVGDRETMGLMEVCDDIHWVRDWRRFGFQPGPTGFSPVHSKSLTALFFPNALSARASRHRP